ncbi:MAG: YncE family protein, partial [Ktedonobacteraceae bacterium]
NGNSCEITKTIATDGPVSGMATAEVGSGTNGGTGNQLWFTTATALNVYQQNNIQKITVPGGPQYLSIPQGATVYVTTRQGTVVAVDLQTLQATKPLMSGGDFGPMDFDAQTGEIYVPDRLHNRLVVLTPLTYGSSTIPPEPNHVIPMAATPQSVAITADGNLGFVALAGGKVAMLDIPGKSLINTLSVGGSPRFIITGLYPPTALPQSTNDNGTPIPTTLLYILAAVALLLLLVIAVLIILAQRRKAG